MQLGQKPYIFDGAMGTYYPLVSKKQLAKCEFANLYEKDTISKIHKEYINAGCMAIRTNTFGANRQSLEVDIDKVKEVIASGYEIASRAVLGTDVSVFADIGPMPGLMSDDLFVSYKEIVDYFLDLGAENFVFETFSSEEYLLELTEHIKKIRPRAFVLIEFAVSPEGFTRQGRSGAKLINSLSKNRNVDAIGFNCYSGPFHLLQYIKTIDIKDMVVSVMPNSGYPAIINNRTFFDCSIEYFASQMLEIAEQGISIIGGCCGTTPEHIKETAGKLRGISIHEPTVDNDREKTGSWKISVKNELKEQLDKGKKIIVVELDPPIDTEIGYFIEGAKKYIQLGVDAITIADCPVAKARVDSSLLACKLKREHGICVIPHMTCRDRNINAAKALLLGLNIEGINNILVITGDPIPLAERDEIKGSLGFNSLMMADFITNLNEKVFLSPFIICGALNVNDKNFDAQLRYAKKKIENGVSIFLTQPILSEQAIENLALAKEQLPAKILGGIFPVVSYRNARFMNSEIPGITVSDIITEKYKDISKEEASKLAIDISVDIAQRIYRYVDGYYVMTPFKRVDLVSDILKKLKKVGGEL